jgi:hypothetical protein
MSRAFERYVGTDYSGAETANSSLSALRVYEASPGKEATEIRTTGGRKFHWTRQHIAEWLAERLSETRPTLIGIDHGFSFPLKYFQKYGLPHDWPAFQADCPSAPLVITIVDREREIIETALAESGGRVAGPKGAAAMLGIPRQTLDSKIASLGVDKRRFLNLTRYSRLLGVPSLVPAPTY